MKSIHNVTIQLWQTASKYMFAQAGREPCERVTTKHHVQTKNVRASARGLTHTQRKSEA